MRQRVRAVLGSMAVIAALAISGVMPAQAGDYWQCVPFARMTSGIEIFGDAWTWWQQAAGHYAQGFSPKAGAVLVFKPNGVMSKGHVAVVSHVLTDRIIQVTHANWSLIGGERGQIEHDVTVVDVSQAGDWSLVKVWNNPSRDLGATTYPTYGFIYQSTENAARTAAQETMRTLTKTAMSPFAGVAAGATGPGHLISQAANNSSDAIAALIQAASGSGSAASDTH